VCLFVLLAVWTDTHTCANSKTNSFTTSTKRTLTCRSLYLLSYSYDLIVLSWIHDGYKTTRGYLLALHYNYYFFLKIWIRSERHRRTLSPHGIFLSRSFPVIFTNLTHRSTVKESKEYIMGDVSHSLPLRLSGTSASIISSSDAVLSLVPRTTLTLNLPHYCI